MSFDEQPDPLSDALEHCDRMAKKISSLEAKNKVLTSKGGACLERLKEAMGQRDALESENATLKKGLEQIPCTCQPTEDGDRIPCVRCMILSTTPSSVKADVERQDEAKELRHMIAELNNTVRLWKKNSEVLTEERDRLKAVIDKNYDRQAKMEAVVRIAESIASWHPDEYPDLAKALAALQGEGKL